MILDDLIGHIVCADCLTVLKDIPDNSIDLVCTDCPYHLAHNGAGGRCAKKWKRTASVFEKNQAKVTTITKTVLKIK